MELQTVASWWWSSLSVVYRIDGMSGHDVHLVAAGCSHHLSESEFRVPDSLHKCK
jgi:hypothetical protein